MAKQQATPNTLGSGDFKVVKERANLVQYIEDLTGTTHKRTGKTIRFNPCPFCGHKDCFSVTGDAGQAVYKCFSGGCGAAGDVITFGEHFKHLSKAEALHDVAKHFSIPISAPKAQKGSRQKKKSEPNPLQEVLEAAIKHYSQEIGRAHV